MMEARLEHRWQSDDWMVFLTDRYGEHGARRIMEPIDTRDPIWTPSFVTLSEGAMPAIEPSLILKTDWLEAIVRAGNEEAGILPPNTAQANHLADAVGVRDRLLGLIERGGVIPSP